MSISTVRTGSGVNFTNSDYSEIVEIRHNIDLTTVRGGYAKFDKNAFFSCLCISRETRSGSFVRVKNPSREFPVGWIVPALYFSEPDEFKDIKYLSDFAYAGFLHFWESDGYATAREHFIGHHLPTSTEFSELFPEGISFAVFSKENFLRSKVSIAHLNLSLLRQGVWPFNGRVDIDIFLANAKRALAVENNIIGNRERSYIETYKIPKACKSVDNLLVDILSRAHQEFSGVGGFMYMYQVAEHLMEVNFSDLVRKASQEDLPAWKLKKKLTEAASEIGRLRKIAHIANQNRANSLIFDVLKEQCDIFIRSCDVQDDEGEKNWIDLVYYVRNIIVHNHMAIIRSGSSYLLENINAALHRAVIELIFCYEQTS